MTAFLCLLLSAPPTPSEAAAEVDRHFAEAYHDRGLAAPEACDDETFLRRASLDLRGRPATVEEVVRFGLDPSADKRAAAVDRMRKSSDAAGRWGRYWADVIDSRATDQRTRVNRPTMAAWFAEQFEAGRPWDGIVTDLITATGNSRETGAVGLMVAHAGEAEEVAAEVSRIFNGIQMSCANCHDHPTDPWTREQFHELAAFFPRVVVRRNFGNGPPSLDVMSHRGVERRPDAATIFRFADANRDGKISRSEAGSRPQLERQFNTGLVLADENKDGALDKAELEDLYRRVANNATTGQGSVEHRMTDLEDPTRPGEVMRPVSFVTGDALPVGASDMERRYAAAAWVTSPDNPWFAKSLVNRYWSVLTGEGFVTPIDDMGPTRTEAMPEVLALLSDGFVQSGYDLNWLLATIARTEVYQRGRGEWTPFEELAGGAVSPITRLDADQLYDAALTALGVESLSGQSTRRFGRITPFGTERDRFREVFFEAPSTPKQDIVGGIPQALLLMNSEALERSIDSDGRTFVAALLNRFDDNRDAVIETYLRFVGREPTADEQRIALAHVRDAGRRAGFEDLAWALLNSAEFLSKR